MTPAASACEGGAPGSHHVGESMTRDRSKTCGAKTRAGGKCGRPRGWGTDHPGYGRCRHHGGASPNGRKAAAKQAAAELARGMLGAAVPTSPLDLMQLTVDYSRGVLAYYHAEILKAYREDDHGKLAELRPQYLAALDRANSHSKAAIDAGVAERSQRLAELQGELVAAIVLRAVGGVFGDLLTTERQAQLAAALGQEFSAVEGEVLEEGPLGLPAVA
jgi:hypothetical protein